MPEHAPPPQPSAPVWPETSPPDLRLRLLNVLSYRAPGPEDVWDEVREWLIHHKIAVPAGVRPDRRPRAAPAGPAGSSAPPQSAPGREEIHRRFGLSLVRRRDDAW